MSSGKIVFEDMIYYKGHFVVIDKESWELQSLKLSDYDCCFKVKGRCKLPESTISNEVNGTKYLVVSVLGDLLMVKRNVECKWKKESDEEVGILDFYETNMFEVFRFDWESKENWKEVKSLGDQALFLMHNDSKSVSCTDSAECRMNCIYFVDDAMEEEHGLCGGKDFGVFDMESKTIERFYSVPFNRWLSLQI
ncbi:F-box protein [Quillaja saponaria]|uniref:F-box protein n=1 Tax=Quillaja saponaria TaxID=32244 RepID=A0AAD7PCY4_QUISA|nr:F-box protein [Quillaja saponaria]